MLDEERPHLGNLPERATLVPYLREDRKVARDSFVSWEGSCYGVHWKWVGRTVQVGQRVGTVAIWSGNERIAVHPRPSSLGSASFCPVSGPVCPGETTGYGRKPWRFRSRWRGGAPLPGRVRLGLRKCKVIALEQARQHLETLGLKQAVEALETPWTPLSAGN